MQHDIIDAIITALKEPVLVHLALLGEEINLTERLRADVQEHARNRLSVLEGELVSTRPMLAKEVRDAERARINFIANQVPYLDRRALLYTLGQVIIDDRPTDYICTSDLEREMMEPDVAVRVLEGCLERLDDVRSVDGFSCWYPAAAHALTRSFGSAEMFALFMKTADRAVHDVPDAIENARCILQQVVRTLRIQAAAEKMSQDETDDQADADADTQASDPRPGDYIEPSSDPTSPCDAHATRLCDCPPSTDGAIGPTSLPANPITAVCAKVFHNDVWVCNYSPVASSMTGECILRIGKLKSSHVCLDDEAVACMHAVIEVSGDEVRVIDLGSATGTVLNGKRIEKIATLADGDTLTFGPFQVAMQITREKPTAS